MKVLYLTGMYPTPAYPQKGIFCHEQVKALKEQGIDVDVVVPVTPYDKDHPPKVWEYEGVMVRYIRFFKIPGLFWFEKIGTFLYWALRLSGIKLAQYDVIHTDVPLPAGYAAMKISQKYGIPYVIHCHGLDVFLNEDYGQSKRYPKIAPRVDQVYLQANAIVGVSRKTLENVQKRLDVASKCHVVYNGVDTESFWPTPKETREGLQLLSVGNLIPLKGHDLSIQAVADLVAEGYRNIHLDIYGRGEKEEELKALVKELGAEEYISFKGYVPYSEVAAAMGQKDVFLLPSWYEAIGCVYLEAMASGMVAIGCHENGIDEVIQSGENGFLVKPHSVEDIVCTLKKICQMSPEERQTMAQKGRQTVLDGFTWNASAQTLKEVYSKLI